MFLQNRIGRRLLESEKAVVDGIARPGAKHIDLSPPVRLEVFRKFRETNRRLFTQYGIPEARVEAEPELQRSSDELHVDRLFRQNIELYFPMSPVRVASESRSSMLNPLNHPVCLAFPGRLAATAWAAHVPFAMFLVDILRPRTIVELGVYSGVSYCAFCQAVKALGLDSRCYAIDTWQGDEHSGFYGSEMLSDLRAYHDPLFEGFSSLIKSTFDDARSQFEDGSIDLLHIDGYHSYESVKHDFESWLPKMSSRGVVLFHDINVRDEGFGVWKLWEEIKLTYPHFEFAHEHGLGVIATGASASEGLRELLELSDIEKHIFRDFFCQLGQRLRTRLEMDQGIHARDARIAGLEGEVSTSRIESQQETQARDARIAALEVEASMSRAESQQEIQARDARIAALEVELSTSRMASQQEIQARDARIAALEVELSTSRIESQQAASLNESLSAQVASLNESLRAQLEHNGKVVSTFENAFNALKAKAEESKNVIDERDRSIARLQHELAELSQTQAELSQTQQEVLRLSDCLSRQNKTIESLENDLTQRGETVQSLSKELYLKTQDFQFTSAQLEHSEQSIRQLSVQVTAEQAEREKMIRTLGWRLLSSYGKLKYPYLLPVYRLLGLTSSEPHPIAIANDKGEKQAAILHSKPNPKE
jgi:Methyltransferase domain